MFSSTSSHQSPSLLSLILPDSAALHRAFMPFVQGGGLFVATTDVLPLGAETKLQVHLMDEPEVFTILGHVVWLTPDCAQDGRIAGVGIQFDALASTTLLPKIQAYLADALASELSNDTM